MKVSGTFTRGFLLGAGVVHRIVSRPGAIRSMQIAAGALGAVVLVYGASRALQMWQEGRDEGSLAPNYAYLR